MFSIEEVYALFVGKLTRRKTTKRCAIGHFNLPSGAKSDGNKSDGCFSAGGC